MSADEHGCAPTRKHHQDESEGSRTSGVGPLLRNFGAGGGQLQHCGALAIAQAREQHDLPVRKLQRIVMGHGVVHVDLPEARKMLSDFLVRENADAERRLAFDILVERNFGARDLPVVQPTKFELVMRVISAGTEKGDRDRARL